MKFLVTVTSATSRETKPCDEAYPGTNSAGHAAWFIDIETLEQLIKFVQDYGHIIVCEFPELSIEIYDDYRE